MENNFKTEQIFLKDLKSRVSDEINKDFILPDVYADIKKIIGCSVKLIPESSYADLGNAYQSGTLECKVLFVSDEGKMRCATFREGYNAKGSYSSPGDDRAVFLPTCESVSVKAANPRKISLRAKIAPICKVFSHLEGECEYIDFDKDELNALEVLSQKVEGAELLSFSSGILEFGDDIQIEKSAPPIEDIVYCDTAVFFKDAQLQGENLLVTGEAAVTIGYTYFDQTGERTRFITHRIPLSDSVEAGGISDKHGVFASGSVSKITCEPFEDASGEKRVAEVDFSYEITVYAYSECEKNIPCDVFSCTHVTQQACECIRYPADIRPIEENFESVALFENVEGEAIGSIAEVRYDPDSQGHTGGRILFTLITENENGAVMSYSKENAFEISNADCDEHVFTVERLSSDFKKEDGQIELSSAFSVKGFGWKEKEMKYVKSVKKLDKHSFDENEAYTVFYPHKNETLWDIAKKYGVPIDVLMSENEITDEKMPLSSCVFVPRRAKSIFIKNV